MNPVVRNTLAAVWSIIYAKTLVYICTLLQTKEIVDSNLSRKLVHVLAGTFLFCWPLFDTTHWSGVMRITLPLVYSIVLFVKGAVIRDSNDADVKTMSRSGDPAELLAGPLYYTSVLTAVSYLMSMQPVGILVLGILSWGDGFAPYFGQRYGKHKYQTFGREKSYLGSFVMFFAAFIGGLVMYIPLLGLPDLYLIFCHFVACSVATIAEALSPADVDNVIIPVVSYLTFRSLGV